MWQFNCITKIPFTDPVINSKLESLSSVLTALAVFCRRQNCTRVVWMNRCAVCLPGELSPDSCLFHCVALQQSLELPQQQGSFFSTGYILDVKFSFTSSEQFSLKLHNWLSANSVLIRGQEIISQRVKRPPFLGVTF